MRKEKEVGYYKFTFPNIRIVAINLVFIAISAVSFSQSVVDSLTAVYPNQTNSEKAKTLGELCYQLAYSDAKLAAHYGELGAKAASATKDSSIIAQSLNDWSIACLAQGDFKKVIRLAQRALKIRVALGDSVGVGKVLNKLANANHELGILDKALSHNLRAIRIFENNDMEVYTGQLISNVGVIYERNGMFEKAVEYYSKAQDCAQKFQDEPSFYTALSSEGTCSTKLKNYEHADSLLKECLAYYIEQENVNLAASTYQNLGFNTVSPSEIQLKKHYYKKAYSLYKQSNSEDGMALIQSNLGHVLMNEGKYDSAAIYLNESLNISLKIGSSYQLKEVYKGLTRLEYLRGNQEKADTYFDLYVGQMDSIYNSETNALVSEMNVKYETEQKQKDLKTEKQKYSVVAYNYTYYNCFIDHSPLLPSLQKVIAKRKTKTRCS